jgi:hypothetical protein
MSVRTLTIILNSNHSKKFALVLQSSDATARDTILREARNKFRIKTLSIVFLQGGTPLDNSESVLRASDALVWVSKGEPYNGPPANPRSRNDNPAEVRVIAEKSFVDTQAIKQLNSIASLPGVRLAVGMPDLHPGSRFPIGCAIASGECPFHRSLRAYQNKLNIRLIYDRWCLSRAYWIRYRVRHRTIPPLLTIADPFQFKESGWYATWPGRPLVWLSD